MCTTLYVYSILDNWSLWAILTGGEYGVMKNGIGTLWDLWKCLCKGKKEEGEEEGGGGGGGKTDPIYNIKSENSRFARIFQLQERHILLPGATGP